MLTNEILDPRLKNVYLHNEPKETKVEMKEIPLYSTATEEDIYFCFHRVSSKTALMKC